jgi:hypothetical protein
MPALRELYLSQMPVREIVWSSIALQKIDWSDFYQIAVEARGRSPIRLIAESRKERLS